MAPRRPVVNFELQSPRDVYSHDDAPQVPQKRWFHYLPICATAFLVLMPHPSLLYVLINYHLRTLHKPLHFAIHLLCTYSLTFLALSSFIVCIARDPGPVSAKEETEDGQMGVTDALMSVDFDAFTPEKWCRKCWAPKPDRTHHCSYCGRCVLKMDHHCPWLGQCIGHRTYPAFLHFLLCVTLLAVYIAVLCTLAVLFAFNNPYEMDASTPLHELFLAFAGIVFTLVIGSFLGYHVYLVHTNQTTLENISPFLLLRFLPPLPRSGLSDPPSEPELSYRQRCLVKDAHGHIRLYDIGWRKNWEQALGWNHRHGWIIRFLYGGASKGDGTSFPRNPACDELLGRLADELVNADKDR